MTTVLAINGSPRTSWNTATMLQKALDGAKAQGAETELIHLYQLDYKGCISCFACKRKGNGLGRCAVKDDLYPLIDKIIASDAVIFGSPIYFGNITGQMLCLLERLFFAPLSYNKDRTPSFPSKLSTAFIYTMNVPEQQLAKIGYLQLFEQTKGRLERFLGGPSEVLTACDTYQFDDYSKFEASGIDAEHKQKMREEQFPIDCQKAYDLGARLAASTNS
ncbi:MAG: flavodoxin family protein [Bacillota bacterium]